MPELQRRMAELRERWSALSARNRVIALTALGVALAALAMTYASSGETADAVLYSNLESDDAARIVERLAEMRVTHEIAEGGTAILVPEERVHATRLTLAAEGLPSGGGVGFEIFDEQRFGESEFAEQVKYHRALEGELSRTIGHLSGVEQARVHLVLPQRSLFTSTEETASASVALRLAPGFTMNEDRVRGIVNLVASSVRGLSAENVTVVDATGRRLAGGGEATDGAVAEDALAYRRQIETAKERAVQQMLDTTLGAGKSIVRVAADVSFTREERTEELFDPEQVAARSFQIDEERDSSATTAAGGIPGTVSNLPGGEAPTAPGTRTEGVVRRSETRNFEISKTVRRAVEPVGRVQRLQVAVMVDGVWSGEGADRVFEPRPDEELERLSGIVAHAVGADTERGDRVTVQCVPFADVAPLDVEEGPRDLIAPYVDPYRPYLPYAGGALAFIVLLIWMLLRKLRRRRVGATSDVPALPTPISVRELESSGSGKLAAAASSAPPDDEDDAELRMLTAGLAERDPEVAARVVRGWLGEGGQ